MLGNKWFFKMALSSSSGRIWTLCKQFEKVFRISSAVNAQHCAVSLTRGQNKHFSDISAVVAPISCVGQYRAVHTTANIRGLEEFFDFPENWGEPTVKSGAPWTAKQLRAKSNEDLHKLWYVLLKERNMLYTIEQEAKRQRVQMPSPERIKKIELSMVRLDTVVSEREDALRLLQTGQEKGRPGAWRNTLLGYTIWHHFREYSIPWYMNRRYMRKVFYTPSFVEPFVRLRIEKHRRDKARKRRSKIQQLAKLKERFPNMKVPASWFK